MHLLRRRHRVACLQDALWPIRKLACLISVNFQTAHLAILELAAGLRAQVTEEKVAHVLRGKIYLLQAACGHNDFSKSERDAE